MYILKILQVNIYSFFGLILLFSATILKMLSKVIEKIFLIIKLVALMSLILMLNMMFINPSGLFKSFLDTIGYVSAFILLVGVLILIIGMFVTIFGSFISMVFYAFHIVIKSLFNKLFYLFHDQYLHLYDYCQETIEKLQKDDDKNRCVYLCPIWQLLRLFRKILIIVFSNLFYISIFVVACLDTYLILVAMHRVDLNFGLGLFEYLQMFPLIGIIFTCVEFVLTLFIPMILIVALSIEWSEWGRLLKYTADNYSTYKTSAYKNYSTWKTTHNFSQLFNEELKAENLQEYFDLLVDMFEHSEALSESFEESMGVRFDSSVLYAYLEFNTLLNSLYQLIQKEDGKIPADVFKFSYVPLIKAAHDFYQKVAHYSGTLHNDGYDYDKSMELDNENLFRDCMTKEEIRKRYKKLVKEYHPDSGGDESRFIDLQRQYELRLSQVAF